MTELSGDTKPQSFDDPGLNWGPEEPAAVDSPPTDDPQTPDTATASTPEAATTPSATEPTPGEAPLDTGPIPLERHKAILEKERKERSELEAKWARTAWADELVSAGKTREQIQDALALFDGIDRDPAGFLERFYEQLQGQPELAPQVRSWAGKVLAGGRKPVEAADPVGDPEPQPDFESNGVPFFSAPQMQKHLQWQQRQMEAKWTERMSPLLTAHQQREQEVQFQRQVAKETESLKAQLEEMRQKPYFTDHEADIRAYLAERQFNSTLQDAYVHVLTTKVLPTLKSTERASTLAELKTQAAASSAKPSSAAPATPVRPRDFDDPSLKWG